MPFTKQKEVKKQVNPNDFDDYGDFMAAKKAAGIAKKEEVEEEIEEKVEEEVEEKVEE